MLSIPTKAFSTHTRPSIHTPKAPYTHLRSSTPKLNPSHPYQALQNHPWPPHYYLALYNHPRPSTRVLGSTHPPKTLIPILDLPYYPMPSRSGFSTSTPFTPIPTHSHTYEALNTYQSVHYQYQALFTHLKSFKPLQALHTHPNLFTPTQALNTLLKPFIPILGPPRPPKDCHTYLWHLMPLLGTPTLFLGLLHLP